MSLIRPQGNKKVRKTFNRKLSFMKSFGEELTRRRRQEIALDPATPPETLAELAKDSIVDVRYSVAENRATSPEILAELGKDRSGNVRTAVAGNPNTPPETLAELSEDTHLFVSNLAARNLFYQENPETSLRGVSPEEFYND